MSFNALSFKQVYLNLFEYFKYREVVPTTNILDDGNLKKSRVNDGYVDIITKPTRARDTMMIYRLLTEETTKTYKKRADLVNKIKGISNKKELKDTKFTIVLITWDANKDLPIADVELSESIVSILHYHHIKFIMNFPKFSYYVPHYIATPEEISSLRVKPTDLPKILESDTGCVWIGAQKGDVVKIERFSENTLKTYVYRLCSA